MSGSFTVVGCGTVVPEADRSCSAYLVDTEERLLLLDCGPGAARSLARIGARWDAIDDIWISHFHADHTGGLPGLLFALKYGLLPKHRTRPLTIRGPSGLAGVIESYATAAGLDVADMGFPVVVREIGPSAREELGSIEIRTMSTPHTDESLAVRVEHATWSLTYSGDSGPDVDLGRFAAGCDLFVCECSLPDSLVGDNHLSPTAVARFATEASPNTLLLTHVYPQFRVAVDVPALVGAAGYGGHVELAVEGWRTSLPV